jgi:outer membrane usher protein
MRQSRLRRFVSFALVMIVAALECARAVPTRAAAAERDLYLEVIVDGFSTGLIAAFRQHADGSLGIAASELGELGIRADPAALRDGWVELDRVPRLTYRYDAARQAIRLQVGEDGRLPRIYDARAGSDSAAPPGEVQTGHGAVLNYLLAGTSDASSWNLPSFGRSRSALSAALDGRLFGPYGVFSQSAILTSATETLDGSLRLDSTWTYADPHSLQTYRGGDLISGGLSWTRPVRLGGVQLQRNFSLRPDLITLPLPQLSGSAAVPSTVDVYTNNVRTYSRDIPPGPFEIGNLPLFAGAGTQRLVVRDALGRETVVDQPYYASAKMLQPGLADYSVETGFRRLYYGVRSNDYDPAPVGSASLRYGLADWLTLEAHTEGGGGLVNGGFGAVVPVSHFGVASLALAGSSDKAPGGLYSASIELGYAGYTLYLRTQRTTSGYSDLASIAPSPPWLTGVALPSTRPPKAIDQAALSVPLRFDPSSVTLSFTHLRDALDNSYEILGASYSRAIWRNTSLFVSGFEDFAGRRNFGVFAGITVALGNGITASASSSVTRSGIEGGVDVIKSQSSEVDTWGWRIRDREGTTGYRQAAASYRAEAGQAQVGIEQFGKQQRANAQWEGAIVYAADNFFFTNRIDDAFAVVDVGAPDVDVFYENRPAGRTNAAGAALIPSLRAYQTNWISIDAKNLPVDADVPRTKEAVVPAGRSGAVVKFGISTDARSAVVALQTASGKPVPPGSVARLEGSEEHFVVGYDGETYVRGLAQQNLLVVELPEGSSCRASFPYRPTDGTRVAIEGVICR